MSETVEGKPTDAKEAGPPPPYQLVEQSGQDEVVPSTTPNVEKRIKALKQTLRKQMDIEREYEVELYKLELKYDKLMRPFWDKLSSIVTGQYEPTAEECNFKEPGEEGLCDDLKAKASLNGSESVDKPKENGAAESSAADNIRGIPDFWVTCLQNSPTCGSYIREYDVPVLTYLENINCVAFEQEPMESNMGFRLEFKFSPNPFFTNDVLTKDFYLSFKENQPLNEFDGAETTRITGCKINWKPSQNVTVTMVKKKPRKAGKHAGKPLTVAQPRPSFFDFFKEPKLPTSDDEDDEDEEGDEADNFDVQDMIGNFIKTDLIRRAVLHYTGEAIESDYDDEDDDEDTDGLGDDGETSEED